MIKVLIIGLGSIGRRHFRNLIAIGETDLVLLRTRKATFSDEKWQAERNVDIASFLPKGQAGNWTRLLSEQDKFAFKAVAGEMLVRWGYEKDTDW